jgi:hypothetical protein
MEKGMGASVNIEVVNGNALTVEADLLALKYAQGFYGVDKQVATKLSDAQASNITPRVGGFRIVPTNGVLITPRVLFVGVAPLYEFRYREIREFGLKVLSSLAGEAPEVRVIALTVHGPGYGLDETECFLSEIAGLADAVASGDYPDKLAKVIIVEQNRGRVERLTQLIESYLPGGVFDADARTLRQRIGAERSETLRAVGYDSGQKPHVFVAMPISDETGDLFHYGIRRAVSSVGYLCERIDQEPSTGDIISRIKERIRAAKFVVAELTGANPNVYLEVGYAWGSAVPTILLIQKDELSSLRFDVAGQRCVVYSTIRNLEEKLTSELTALIATASKEEQEVGNG